MRVTLMLCAFFSLTTMSASGGEQLRIVASPVISYAPSSLSIRARVVPNDENRTLDVVAESSDFYRSSQIPMDGERAPATIMVDFRDLPGGYYVIYAILTDQTGHERAVARQTVRVIGPGL